MAWIGADHPHHTFAADNLAILTHPFDAGAYFHGIRLRYTARSTPADFRVAPPVADIRAGLAESHGRQRGHTNLRNRPARDKPSRLPLARLLPVWPPASAIVDYNDNDASQKPLSA